MSSSDDLPATLAPDEQPGVGRAWAEPGEWFSLFNPMGGGEAARPPDAGPAPAAQGGSFELSDLVERWVRRVALGGDQRRGVAKLDIGHGRFSGAELVVVAEAGVVTVEVSLPGAGEPDLAARLRSRLERRGFVADVVVR